MPALPATSPPTASTTPTDPPTRPAWWNHLYTASCVLGVAYLGYQFSMFGAIGSNGWEQLIAPQLDRMFSSTLAMGAALSFIGAIARMLYRWHAEDREWKRGVCEALTELLQRRGSETTSDLGSRPTQGRVVYMASTGVYNGTSGVTLDDFTKRIETRFTELENQIFEFGNQRYFSGHAAGFEDSSGTPSGSVTALTPRNGHRTSS